MLLHSFSLNIYVHTLLPNFCVFFLKFALICVVEVMHKIILISLRTVFTEVDVMLEVMIKLRRRDLMFKMLY